MTAYAIAHLRSVSPWPEVVRYLEEIDATLEPFGGRFIIHGDDADVRDRATDVLSGAATAR